MGLLRFDVQSADLLSEDRLARSFVAGPDESPYYGRTIRNGSSIVIERREDASGCFTLPWPIEGHGDWLIATSTLMERARPYLLEVELARGLVFRLRDQMGAWEQLGLAVADPLRAEVAEATRLFTRAATQQANPAAAAGLATQALQAAATASCNLAGVYAEQALAFRRAGSQTLSTLMGVRLTGDKPVGARSQRIVETCNLIGAPCGWGAVERSEGRRDWSEVDAVIDWARSNGLRVCGGPLLEFDDRRLPDWAYLWEGDLDTLASLMIGHVRSAVERYKGRVQLWNVASRVNRTGVLSLSDEHRLSIVAGAVKAVRQIDPQTPVVVGIDQPWGEYRGRTETELAPLDFADALERADLGIAGFDLELNIGYYPLATALRNPLAFSRLIDLWNVRLESPLMLTLTLPSSPKKDSKADPQMKVVAGGEGNDQLVTPEWQATWARDRLTMLLAKNAVQVILWGHLSDALPHCFPHGGLYDAKNAEKPIVAELQRLRAEYLA
ncbi:endo-1,4-beta-xylanase [Botrimarina hoheduenensis]|uniref:Endo-1,4-beta-xylanase C n=1 Tax=Botrimarina hoheduenensis TaxID=2528000 RepID=A0A5C5VZK0_9BACT|nr:endo-1,4-beta-xylanase [Botrimarina hoheduenensis]TWT43403.1 Endo-1,4-beta-xylanase C precursor [Botrimarina hoheduenensis]